MVYGNWDSLEGVVVSHLRKKGPRPIKLECGRPSPFDVWIHRDRDMRRFVQYLFDM